MLGARHHTRRTGARWRALPCCAAALLAACSADLAAEEPRPDAGAEERAANPTGEPHQTLSCQLGDHLVAEADGAGNADPASLAPAAAGEPVLVYVNPFRTTYRRLGQNDEDSRENVSSRLPEEVSSLEVPGWSIDGRPVDGDTWNRTLDCLDEVLGPFNFAVTGTDPGYVDHVEVHLGGAPGLLGLGGNIAGVAAMDQTECRTVENPIAYVFPEVVGHAPRRVCETIAHEVAHGFGVDHILDCNDPMSYEACGERTFQFRESACGGDPSPRPCHCGKPTHNAARTLLDKVGPGPRPTLWLINLRDGDMVSSEGAVFDVAANREPPSIRAAIDGEPASIERLGGRSGYTRYRIHPSSTLRTGEHIVSVTGAFAERDVNVSALVEVGELGDDQYQGGNLPDLRGGCAVSSGERSDAGLLVAVLLVALMARRETE